MNYLLKYTLAFLLLTININSAAMHAIHISYGEATLKGNEFFGKLTFYYDDFMLALKNWKGENIKNFSAKQYTELKNNYLKKHLIALVNNNIRLNLIITGNSGNDKSIWFEFKFTSAEKINIVNLKYDVLMNEYSDQLNLLNVASPSGDHSLIFSQSKNEIKIIN